MKQHSGNRHSLKNLLRDERGAFLIMTTVYLPVIVGFFTLAVDMSYVLQTRNMLQVTAEAAALAATAQLPDQASSCAVAKTYATTIMQNNGYTGTAVNVLKQNTSDCSDVVLGKWAQSCAAGTNCFQQLPAGQTCPTFQCNAVQVTTRMATLNNNPLNLAFAPMIGWSTFDVTATATAVYGSATGTWDVALVQDISGSFTAELPTARAADTALEACINANSLAGSRMGITVFGTTSLQYQTPLAVTTNDTTLKNAIQNFPPCNDNPPNGSTTPKCSTDIAAGINTAVASYQALDPPPPARNGLWSW